MTISVADFLSPVIVQEVVEDVNTNGCISSFISHFTANDLSFVDILNVYAFSVVNSVSPSYQPTNVYPKFVDCTDIVQSLSYAR